MNIWADNVDELEELSANHLPEPWQRWVKNGEMLFSDVPEDLRFSAMDRGMEDFMSRQIDGLDLLLMR